MFLKIVPMSRRDMLQGSIKSAARALPAMIGTVSGLAELFKKEERNRGRPSCFPSSREKVNEVKTPNTHDEEERK